MSEPARQDHVRIVTVSEGRATRLDARPLRPLAGQEGCSDRGPLAHHTSPRGDGRGEWFALRGGIPASMEIPRSDTTWRWTVRRALGEARELIIAASPS